jgi:hypothetical protein
MKFLPDNIRAYRSDYDLYSKYAILEVRKQNSELISGPGMDCTLNYPRNEYVMPNDYPDIDNGWDKIFSAKKFISIHGEREGCGIGENGQLPLFNLFQTYSMWSNLHSNKKFTKYLPCMIGITYLDMIYRFNSITASDPSLSNSVIDLINDFHKTELGPPPLKIIKNDRDLKEDYNKYEVSMEKNNLIEIPQEYLYYGHLGFKYEMSRLQKNPIDLESPRWWEQRKIKSIDLSDIICDNQMVMF